MDNESFSEKNTNDIKEYYKQKIIMKTMMKYILAMQISLECLTVEKLKEIDQSVEE